MKLITFGTSVDENKAVRVEQTTGGYTVSFAGASIDIGAHLFKPGELQFLMYGKQYENEVIGIVTQREYVDSRDGLTILAQHGLTDGLGWFYFGDSANEACLCITKAMMAQCPFDIVQPGKPRDVLPGSISHDGPGQHVRGPDPLEDPLARQAILELYRRLAPQGRFSFNAMVNRSNQSRAAIQAFFAELTGDPDVMIGEGGFVDAYDDGGRALSLKPDEFHAFRRQAFQEIRQGKAGRISSVRDRTMSFVNSLRFKRPASSLGQKCGMDRTDSIAVDLKGNVLTCQNVSAAAVAPNGESHRIGHISQMQDVALKTATHWSHRQECPGCPMLQICKGACMFLEGPLWDVSCDNAYSDALPIFAAGIEFLTGLVPVHIEGELREERKDIFGFSEQARAPRDSPAKPFPIAVVAA